MPKISVVIPVYNTEKFLNECLDSVLNQTFSDIEVLCIDDGSNDKSLKILNEYSQKDERIKIFETNHKGSGGARNVGLKEAKGEYIIFLDSDDFFELNMFEEMYNKAKETKSDITICNYNTFDIKNNNFLKTTLQVFPKNFFEKEYSNYTQLQGNIFYYFHNAAWNKLYRLDFLKEENIKFQEIKRTNDLYFTKASLFLAKRISGVDKDFVHYRIGQTSNLQRNNHKCPLEFAKALIALKDFLIEKELYNELKNSYEKFATYVINCNLSSLNKNLLSKLELYIYIYRELANKLNIPIKTFNPIFALYQTATHNIITIIGIKIQTKIKSVT